MNRPEDWLGLAQDFVKSGRNRIPIESVRHAATLAGAVLDGVTDFLKDRPVEDLLRTLEAGQTRRVKRSVLQDIEVQKAIAAAGGGDEGATERGPGEP